MRVNVLFFGLLRDITGCAQEQLELPGPDTLDTLFARYAGRFPKLANLKASIVLARNQQFSPGSASVEDGDEVAFLPPVSGGSARLETDRFSNAIFSPMIQDKAKGQFFALTRQPIEARQLAAELLRAEDGALVIFEGVVRDNTKGRATKFLDYECYEPMAIQVMAKLGFQLSADFQLGGIAMVHRLGRMEIGETSVAIAVTSPHRRAALQAASEAIDRLKRLVPIWKKEHFADGEVWVEGEWDESVLGI